MNDQKPDPFRKLARWVADIGLATPAVFFIESVKPLGFLLSQVARFCEPFLSLVVSPEEVDAFAGALEERQGLERLARCIEEEAGRKRA